MNEMDILCYFYDELRIRGQTRDTLFLNLDEQAVENLQEKLKEPISLETLHEYADICIANEWLERTTVDPGYNFLSLTEAGLQIAIGYEYEMREKK